MREDFSLKRRISLKSNLLITVPEVSNLVYSTLHHLQLFQHLSSVSPVSSPAQVGNGS